MRIATKQRIQKNCGLGQLDFNYNLGGIMRVKEVLQRRDKLRGYLHSLAIAKNFCDRNIANPIMIDDLDSIYKEIEKEFKLIDESLKPFEDMDM